MQLANWRNDKVTHGRFFPPFLSPYVVITITVRKLSAKEIKQNQSEGFQNILTIYARCTAHEELCRDISLRPIHFMYYFKMKYKINLLVMTAHTLTILLNCNWTCSLYKKNEKRCHRKLTRSHFTHLIHTRTVAHTIHEIQYPMCIPMNCEGEAHCQFHAHE